jgi:hypothetical protein
MERWWCLDCRGVTELNRHGRCECCGSEAVDVLDRRRIKEKDLRSFTVASDFRERAPQFGVEIATIATSEPPRKLPPVLGLGTILRKASRRGNPYAQRDARVTPLELNGLRVSVFHRSII